MWHITFMSYPSSTILIEQYGGSIIDSDCISTQELFYGDLHNPAYDPQETINEIYAIIRRGGSLEKTL